MVIPRVNQQVLMEKRPPAGIWGGLWCFLEISDTDELAELLSKLNLAQTATFALDKFRHTFSHFHLDIEAIVIDCELLPAKEISENSTLQWYNLATTASVGLAASTQKLIKQLEQLPV